MHAEYLEQARSKAAALFADWDIPAADSRESVPMTKKKLSVLLDTAAPLFPTYPARYIPTSFDADDPDLRALPRPADAFWTSCERFFAESKTERVMTRLPLFWQTGFELYRACQSVAAPLFTNDPENMPVGARALRTAGIDTLVTESSDAARFLEYCALSGQTPLPRVLLIIHPISSAWTAPKFPDTIEHVRSEVHVFPGVPVLVQCSSLARSDTFHVADEFELFIRNNVASVTEKKNDVFPLIGFELERPLHKLGSCECGDEIYSAQYE